MSDWANVAFVFVCKSLFVKVVMLYAGIAIVLREGVMLGLQLYLMKRCGVNFLRLDVKRKITRIKTK